jgi:hypothetical protein
MNTTTTETTTNTTWQDAAAASATAEERAADLAMPPRRFEQMLPCTLTDDELRERGDEIVKVLQTIDDIKAEKKIATDGLKARIQIQESRGREIREAIRSKSEDRSVECIESFHFRLGVARVTRTDTGEQVSERALRASERQPSLPLPEPQMSLADAQHADDLEPEAPGSGDIVDPDAVLAAATFLEPPKTRRGRKAST